MSRAARSAARRCLGTRILSILSVTLGLPESQMNSTQGVRLGDCPVYTPPSASPSSTLPTIMSPSAMGHAWQNPSPAEDRNVSSPVFNAYAACAADQMNRIDQGGRRSLRPLRRARRTVRPTILLARTCDGGQPTSIHRSHVYTHGAPMSDENFAPATVALHSCLVRCHPDI